MEHWVCVFVHLEEMTGVLFCQVLLWGRCHPWAMSVWVCVRAPWRDDRSVTLPGVAVRTLSSLSHECVSEHLEGILVKALADRSAYVRRAAVMGCARLHQRTPGLYCCPFLYPVSLTEYVRIKPRMSVCVCVSVSVCVSARSQTACPILMKIHTNTL